MSASIACWSAARDVCRSLISSTDNDIGGFLGLVESREVSLQGLELSASWRQASLHRPLNTVRSVFATAGPCLTLTAFKCRPDAAAGWPLADTSPPPSRRHGRDAGPALVWRTSHEAHS